MINYIFVIIATVLLAFEFAFSKKYQMCEGTSPVAGLKFNAIAGFFTIIIFFCLNGFKFNITFFSIVMAFFMSLCGVLYSIIGFRVLKFGNMALYSIFLMSGGMLLPYVFGVLFLDEKLSILRIIGVVIILAAVILSNLRNAKLNKSIIFLCIAVFVLNGCVSIISKCHQVATAHETVNSTEFVMLSGICKLVLCSAVLLCYRPKKEQISFSGKIVPLIIAAAALIGGVSYMFQLMGAKELPATVLYPLVTGGSIIFSALSGLVFFREKITKMQIISICLCFAGTLFFL